MDDVEEVIKRAKKIHASEKREYLYANKLSDLPASKDAMKESIKERIRLLCGMYISLATYVCDEDFKTLITGSKRQKRAIYKKMVRDMDVLRKEIKDFEQKIVLFDL